MKKSPEPSPKNRSDAAPEARAVLRVAECAEKLGVSREHIIDLIDEGKLRAIDVGGGSRHFYRIPIEAFEDFLKRGASV
jgi:excisionase family DNA binding protein